MGTANQKTIVDTQHKKEQSTKYNSKDSKSQQKTTKEGGEKRPKIPNLKQLRNIPQSFISKTKLKTQTQTQSKNGQRI